MQPNRILLVDDDPSILHALTARLTHLGHIVEARPDAMTAIAEIGDLDPDIAIIDINLQGVSGFELARLMDERDPQRKIRKIFLTASKDPHLKEQALAMGAAGYLEKPYSPGELAQLLDYCADDASEVQ